MKKLRSLYRDSEKQQFECEILNENENDYFVRLLPEWRDQFQDGDKITTIPKRVVTTNKEESNLYLLIDDEKEDCQLTIFD